MHARTSLDYCVLLSLPTHHDLNAPTLRGLASDLPVIRAQKKLLACLLR